MLGMGVGDVINLTKEHGGFANGLIKGSAVSIILIV